MLYSNCNWEDIKHYLYSDNRVVLVLGATEEHADLSICTDTLIPFYLAKAACSIENVLLAPPIHYGLSQWASAYPGTITLNTTTYICLVKDIVESLLNSGFRKLLILNGHGFNRSVCPALIESLTQYENSEIIFEQWYDLPTVKKLRSDIPAGHATWIETFSFNKLYPGERKQPYLVSTTPNMLINPKKLKSIMKKGYGIGKLNESNKMDDYFSDIVQDICNILKQMKGNL